MNPLQYLIPTSFFEGLFLMLPLTLFALGYYYKSKLEVSWEKKIATVNLNEGLLGIFSTKELIDAITPSKQRFIYSLPGIFLIIGLLGTFWGLGLGMVKMDAAINSTGSNMTSSLKSSLADLSVQFKSSIWGIFFSLLTRVIFGDIAEKQLVFILKRINQIALSKTRHENEYKNNVLNLLQENNLQLNTLQAKADIGNHLTNELNIKYQSTVDAINDLRESNITTAHDLKQAAQEFVGGARDMSKIISQFEKEMTVSLKEMGLVINTTKNFIETSRIAIESSVEALKGEIKSSLLEFSAKIAETLKGVSGQLTESTVKIEHAINQSMKMVDSSTKNSSILISDATNRLNDQVLQLSKDITTNLNQVSGILRKSQEQLAVQIKVNADLNGWLANLNESSDNLNNMLKVMDNRISEMTSRSAEVVGHVSSLLSSGGIIDTKLQEMVENQKKLNIMLNKKG